MKKNFNAISWNVKKFAKLSERENEFELSRTRESSAKSLQVKWWTKLIEKKLIKIFVYFRFSRFFH